MGLAMWPACDKSKGEGIMKRLFKLLVAAGLAAATLSACVVVPVGPPPHAHRGYYGGGYYGGGGYGGGYYGGR